VEYVIYNMEFHGSSIFIRFSAGCGYRGREERPLGVLRTFGAEPGMPT